MKRPFFPLVLTVFFFSLNCVSCSQQTEQISVVDEPESIRYAVKQARDNVNWTVPIEPEALSEAPAGEMKNVRFFPGAGFTIMNSQDFVYPSLEDFGSLDTSGMSKALITGVNDFLTQLSRKKLSFTSSFFEKPYEGVVILYEASNLDDITGWKIGKPFIGSGSSASYEIPVQLIMNDKKVTVKIYLNPEKAALDEFVVQQVMFGAVKSGE